MFKFLEKKWSEEPINRNKKSQNFPNFQIKNNIEVNINNKILNFIDNISDLELYIKNFDECKLKNSAKNTVVFDGNINAKLFIIGEAPGDEEDKKGKPFVGMSGKLLRNTLENCGFKNDDFYITNCVFWRPPLNRRPTQEEVDVCKPMVMKQIDIIKPKLILLLGSVALNMFLGDKYMITRIRGQLIEHENYKIVCTFHPSYILRMQQQKTLFVDDLKLLKNTFDLI